MGSSVIVSLHALSPSTIVLPVCILLKKWLSCFLKYYLHLISYPFVGINHQKRFYSVTDHTLPFWLWPFRIPCLCSITSFSKLFDTHLFLLSQKVFYFFVLPLHFFLFTETTLYSFSTLNDNPRRRFVLFFSVFRSNSSHWRSRSCFLL